MQRMLMLFVLVLCVPVALLGQAQTYIGYFNDGARTICGQGCQTSEPETHPMCDATFGAPGNWTHEEAWLWLCVEEGGIDQIRFQVGFDPHDRECMMCGNFIWNDDIVASHSLHYTFKYDYDYNFTVDFSECVSGWVWIHRAQEYNCIDWDLYLRPWMPEVGAEEPAVITRSCQPGNPEHEAIVLCHYHFYAVPADECPAADAVGNQRSSWGAIKSIYR